MQKELQKLQINYPITQIIMGTNFDGRRNYFSITILFNQKDTQYSANFIIIYRITNNPITKNQCNVNINKK
jgi:hypothetical protein